jgi:aryl-alcohol dehydrogenase-like predicted oxidoreductase
MGLLAGRYRSYNEYPPGSRAASGNTFMIERLSKLAIDKSNAFIEVAESENLTPSQLALLWLKDQPAVAAPIIGPRTEAHLDDALPVLDMHLSPETAARLDAIVPPGSVVSDFHNSSKWIKMKVISGAE